MERKKTINKKSLKTTPKWFYIVIVLIPIIFFSLLEAGLRIFHYGKDFPVFIQVSNDQPELLNLNPELPAKYFTNLSKAPGIVPDTFEKMKKENAFRVFVLGESSTAGWPFFYNASFPANLRKRLELLYPENPIEIINCGISAISTYTIKDIIPDIIEQKPDLILIYAGHNEYYGALGVGSKASLGKSRTIINAYLWALKIKTVQLIADIVSEISSFFSTSNTELRNSKPETLMSAMIEESLIPLNSELYKLGIEQFESNISDILQTLNEEKIPVIIGTLTCNTKDLKPFISIKYDSIPPAEIIFEEAKKEYEEGNIKKAEELFLYAKELDALRFRAPIKINQIIKETAYAFNAKQIDIDSIFRASSPDGIVGYNLTVDHLHPNLEGHRLIAASFFAKMEECKFLPKGKRINLSENLQDSTLIANFPFTALDSVLAYLKTIQLTGTYPFVPRNQTNLLITNFEFKNFVDSAAIEVLNQKISWGTAHLNIAMRYYDKGEFKKFLKEMDCIIAAKPFDDKSYEQTIDMLIDAKQFNEAIPYLEKLQSLKPSFFTAKWLGYIALQNKNYGDAEKYLEESVSYSDKDYQVWYNLAGIYYNKKEFNKSLIAIERSLALNPDYPYAKNIYQQLKNLINK